MATAALDPRLVPMTAAQAQVLEDVGVQMVRDNDERAAKMMALTLEYKFAKARAPDRLDRELAELRKAVDRPDSPALTLIRGGRDDA